MKRGIFALIFLLIFSLPFVYASKIDTGEVNLTHGTKDVLMISYDLIWQGVLGSVPVLPILLVAVVLFFVGLWVRKKVREATGR